jgi:hypothetical protein
MKAGRTSWLCGLLGAVFSWVGYLLLLVLFFYGIYEAYQSYNWLTALIVSIPIIGQIYWFLIRRDDLGLFTWFTYAYGIALGCIMLSWVFMWLHYRRRGER